MPLAPFRRDTLTRIAHFLSVFTKLDDVNYAANSIRFQVAAMDIA